MTIEYADELQELRMRLDRAETAEEIAAICFAEQEILAAQARMQILEP